jgi:hypothetical protein
MTQPQLPQIEYAAFGRGFPTVLEAEDYGRTLMANESEWTHVEAPTSFIVFIQSARCMPVELWRVHK